MKTWMRRLFPALVAALALAAMLGPATAGASNGSTVRLNGVKTTLTTDTATTGVLVSNGILPLPVGDATVKPRFDNGLSLRYSFPITGGRVNAASLAGYIRHSGGLRFVNITNGKSLKLTKFKILIGARPGLTAVVNGDPKVRVRILNLDLSGASVTKHIPWVTVKGVHATLTRTAASALNASLGVSFFARGISLGTANVYAHVA